MQGVDIMYAAELLLSARRKLFQMLHEIRVELLSYWICSAIEPPNTLLCG